MVVKDDFYRNIVVPPADILKCRYIEISDKIGGGENS